MTLAPGPLGVHAKIKRAEQHLDEFKVALRANIEATGTRVEILEIEDLADAHRVTGLVTPSDPPPEIGVYVGDAIHNLRSALDHLVCQLAVAAGNASACERATQFPVYAIDTADNRRNTERWIKAISAAAQIEIRALQPHRRRSSDPFSDPLWMLSELDNIDKHRLLLVVNPRLAELQLHFTIDGTTTTRTVSNHPDWKAMSYPSMRFRLTVPRDTTKPTTDVTVKADTMTGVVFAETGLRCDGAEIFPTIRNMVADVKGIVDSFVTKGLIT